MIAGFKAKCKKKIGKVGGFMVSLWGVLPFDSVGKLHLNEK